MNISLDLAVVLITGLLMVINFLAVVPKENKTLKEEYKARYLIKISTIPIIFILTIVSLIKSFNDAQEKEVERKALVSQIRFKDTVIDSIYLVSKKADSRYDSLYKIIDSVKTGVKNIKPGNTIIQNPAGTPVFGLCANDRANITPYPEGTGTFSIKANFCADRDITELKIWPTYLFKTGSQIVVLTKSTQQAWEKDAMTKGDTFAPVGTFRAYPRPDTIFLRFKISFKNRDGQPSRLDQVYYLVWGTNKWWGALPSLQRRVEAMHE